MNYIDSIANTFMNYSSAKYISLIVTNLRMLRSVQHPPPIYSHNVHTGDIKWR